MFISYVIPTRDRPEALSRTLGAIGALDGAAHERAGGAEVIVVDNASRDGAHAPARLANGLAVRVIRLEVNRGAAGRNEGARAAHGRWLVMLDDDSYPLDTGHLGVLAHAGSDVGAIGAEILLPDGSHEAGGLPEVFVGCGAAVRRAVFLEAGGYDESFEYYVEEYDLCARLIMMEQRIEHVRSWRVFHEKTTVGRDMDGILRRLVRNNGWVDWRYGPERVRSDALGETLVRYRAIAEREGAVAGYTSGLAELNRTVFDQPRREMSGAEYDRFTGLAHARARIGGALRRIGAERVALVEPGKNAWAVERAVVEAGARVVERKDAQAIIIATLSPGPMLDAMERIGARSALPVVAPWSWRGAACGCA